jgi:putative membrane protein
MPLPDDLSGFDPNRMERPAPQLFTYYILGALFSGPFIVFTLPILWFRYQTLRYRFEDEGLRMQVGLIFRKETVTAYRRIQDIHLTSNVIQRWLGIASISIQTASGSAMPEIVIEGVTEPEKLRDWLYERLRGARFGHALNAERSQEAGGSGGSQEEVLGLLVEIRDHLAALAQRLPGGKS